MNPNLDAPRLLDQDDRRMSGVRESASDNKTCTHSGDAAVFEEARAART